MVRNSVVVIGSLNYDIIFKQDRLPKLGETLSVNSVSYGGGGKGANQAVQCGKLGLSTYMIGKVGNDTFGQELLASMNKYNVNTDHIGIANTNTGLGVVNSLPDGSLLSTISKGSNYELTKDDIDHAESIISNCSIVILQLEIDRNIVEYAIKLAKRHGCYVILNAAPSYELNDDIMKLVDCLVVNESEASFYANQEVSTIKDAEQVCESLYSKIGELLVITLGEKGSLLYDGKEKHHISPEKVEVLETTGAGDSYIGALAYGLINNKPYHEIGSFAAKVSAKTIMGIGAQESMPTLSDMDDE